MTEDSKFEEEKRRSLNTGFSINKDWKFKESFPTISAYTTTYNCIKNGYPIFDAIRSFSWADEIVAVDGGSTDGTIEELEKLKAEIPQLKVYEIGIDWDSPGKDGQQKAMAKAMCASRVFVQFDADEICLGDPKKWKKMAKDLFGDVLELPVIEPFGKITNVRMNKEHNPVKWRIYSSRSNVTHGIPRQDKLEKDGKVYSKGHSDGCFPIDVVSENMIPSYMSEDARRIKILYNKFHSLGKHDEKRNELKAEYTQLIKKLLSEKTPCVLHLGHANLEQKIHLYLNEWKNWWAELYGKDSNDISLYFENKTVEEVTENDIKEKAASLMNSTPSIDIEELSEIVSFNNEKQGNSL